MIGSQYVRGNPQRYFPTNKCWAYLTADQSLTINVWTKVALDATIYDVESEFNTTLNRFVAKTAGYYLVIGQVAFANYPRSGYAFWILLATSAAGQGNPNDPVSGVNAFAQNVHDPYVSGVCAWTRAQGIVKLAVGDYIEMYVQQSDATGRTVDSSKKATGLFVTRLP